MCVGGPLGLQGSGGPGHMPHVCKRGQVGHEMILILRADVSVRLYLRWPQSLQINRSRFNSIEALKLDGYSNIQVHNLGSTHSSW